MAKITKKSIKQFVSGFFVTYALWTLGLAVSGCILFVEMIEFYDSPSFLIAVFSALFLISLVIASVICAKNEKKKFFIGMMFAVVFPIISQLIAAGLFSLCDIVGSMGAGELILVPLTVFAFLFIAPAFPVNSINYKWATFDIGEEWPEYVFITVMVLTIILPVAVYLIVSKKKHKT